MSFQKNAYEGCATLQDMERIPSSTTPQEVFERFVSQRKPVVFSNHLNDAEWKVNNWTNAYLKKRAGDATMKAEFREKDTDKFGRGQEKQVTFEKFLDEIESKSPNWYMTTQDLVYDAEGMPGILSAPLDHLTDDFPLVPHLLKTLITSNINTWIGFSKTYSTSGLHHDFHDNLYILLRGEKRFTLYSPAETLNMYTSGECIKIHPNGRINYRGQPTTADGSDENSQRAAKAAEELEKAASKLHSVSSGANANSSSSSSSSSSSNNVAAIEEAEDEIDRALDAVLAAEIATGDWSDEDDDDDEEDEEDFEDNEENDEDEDEDKDFAGDDDYEEDEDDREDVFHHSGEESDEDDEEKDIGPLFSSRANKKRSAAAAATTDHSNNDNCEDDAKGSKRNKLYGTKKTSIFDYLPKPKSKTESKTEKSGSNLLPSNFSTVDQTLSDVEMAKQFPRFADVKRRKAGISFVLKAGEMLYLPAGWWHEVESRNAADNHEGRTNVVPGEGHMAFNYWFHPPDSNDFNQPYTSKFWADVFKRQQSAIVESSRVGK